MTGSEAFPAYWNLPSFQETPDVLARAPHEYWQAIAAMDISYGCPGLAQEEGKTVWLIGIDYIDQVVRDGGALLGGGLGCANVHIAVDLATIRAYDLAAQFLSQLDGQCGLAGGRCTY